MSANLMCRNVFALARTTIIFFFLNILYVANHHVDSHTVSKRMDLESCIGRFDVKLDMIIRTEESRSMGAKFLDHADLGSREECLRLCCETDDCDVFVFEEKNEGTCFLFQCGPAQNFRCKFTHHANYTSAVLTPKRTIDPPPPKKQTQDVTVVAATPPVKSTADLGLSQHEVELSNLKEKPSRGDAVSTTLIPPLGVRPGSVTTTRAPRTPTQQLCSRFQFQCHSGECIAVYNACDGIPQCVDGSDEGPECPVNAVITSKPHIVDLNIPLVDLRDISQINNNIMQRQQSGNAIVPLQKVVQRPYAAVQQQQQQQHNREDPMTAPEWPPLQDNEQQLYNTDSHIFNHKGGLQLPGNTNSIAQQYISNNGYVAQQQQQQQQQQKQQQQQQLQQRESYMQPMQEVYRIPSWTEPRMPQWPQQQAMGDNQLPVQLQRQEQQQQQQDLAEQQLQRPDWPVRPILPVATVPVQNAASEVEKPVESSVVAGAKSTGNHVKSSEYDDDNSASEDDDDPDEKPSTVPPPQRKKKQRKHKKDKADHHKHEEHDRPVHEQLKNIKNGLEIEFMDHDGAAERPGGAVLSLTLGIIVTAALAVLVGCRANVVRRRTRRGGKSAYAHDADFLVNGMYL